MIKLVKAHNDDVGLGPTTNDELFEMFDTDGNELIDEEEFVSFFENADTRVDVELPELSGEDVQALFKSLLSPGKEELTKPEFKQFLGGGPPKPAGTGGVGGKVMMVVKATCLTEGSSIGSGVANKNLRLLRLGEQLEVLEGPKAELAGGITLNRVRVKARSDGAQGWVTVAGNGGTKFLTEMVQPGVLPALRPALKPAGA